jgi:serine/threonine-protein kinase
MSAITFDTCREFIETLTECKLLLPADRERLEGHAQAHPNKGPREPADFLVGQKLLTRFQARTVLEGGARSLVLSLFTLVDEIGTGSMGTVYKARSARDENWYAIKIVPRRNVVDLASIAEKVQAFKQVRHPRVSALMHLGATGERVYLVWPFLEAGEKLDALIGRQGALPWRTAAQVVMQVASGLQAYHEHGLFHGLLKPSDILIGTGRRVRVMDFGVGFLLTSERGKSLLDTMTNSKALARGVDCASPESILDPLARTPAGDQYSLGCILYFCLAGQFPFPGNNPVKKMLAHQNDEPTPVGELAPQTPQRLVEVVERLMSKDPEGRYESIAEVVKELQAITSSTRPLPPAARKSVHKSVHKSNGAVKLPAREAATGRKKKSEKEEPGDRPGWLTPALLSAGLFAGSAVGILSWWLTRR